VATCQILGYIGRTRRQEIANKNIKVSYLHTKPHEQVQKHVCLHTKNIQRQKKVQSCTFEFKATKCKDLVITDAYTKHGLRALL